MNRILLLNKNLAKCLINNANLKRFQIQSCEFIVVLMLILSFANKKKTN